MTDPTSVLLARRAPLHASASSDGRVALTTVHIPDGADDGELSLTVLDLATGQEHPVPHASTGDHSAVWGPDGVAMAWCSHNDEGVPVLRWVARLGDVPNEVPGSERVTGAPAWSPDGQSVAFTAPAATPVDRSQPYRWTRPYLAFDGLGPLDAPPQVRVVELATGQGQWLTADDWRWSSVRWAPDGVRLAACAGADPLGLRGGQHVALLALRGEPSRPELPSGRTVVPVWRHDNSLAVLVVDPHDRPVGAVARLFIGGNDGWTEVAVNALLGGDVYGDHQAELCDTY